MNNMYYGVELTSSRRRRRRRKGPILLILLLLAVAIGAGGFFLAKYFFEKKEENTPQIYESALWASADQNIVGSENNESGIYGLWTEEKPTDAPSNQPAEDEEEKWMGDFVDTRTRVKAKGIYLSSSYFNKRLEAAIELADNTEINAMVIDIKNDAGFITYQMDCETAKQIGACSTTIGDIDETIKRLKEHGIYLIARIVTLKDPMLADRKPELALKNKDGTIFRDSSRLAWVNPYEDKVWDYLIEVCKQCVAVGFDEVNLDYIRFSTDKGMSNVDFGPKAEEMTRIEVITNGIRRICEEIKPLGAFVSCDVYGAIISSSVDAKIVGQSYFNMAKYLDYICPMVYPSHYGDGYYGIDYPDCHPYELVYHALMDSQKVLYMLDPEENKAEVRPWLQDFTATWVTHHLKYGEKEVRDEINAVYDAGYSQWLLWNAGIVYTEGALEKSDQ